MNTLMKTAVAVAGVFVATQAAAQVTFYSRDDFRGRTFTTDKNVHSLDRTGFNDFASSVVVKTGNWEVCEDPDYQGRCVVLRPGSYRSLAEMKLENRISSARAVEGS